MLLLTIACRQRAGDWALLAADKSFTEEQRRQFLELSTTWDQLGRARSQKLSALETDLMQQADGIRRFRKSRLRRGARALDLRQ